MEAQARVVSSSARPSFQTKAKRGTETIAVAVSHGRVRTARMWVARNWAVQRPDCAEA